MSFSGSGQSLCSTFPILHSHNSNKTVSVREVVQRGFCAFLVPRLSNTADVECSLLEGILSTVALTPNEDARFSMFEKGDRCLDSAKMYKASTHSFVPTPGLQVCLVKPRPTESEVLWLATTSKPAPVLRKPLQERHP